MKKLLRLLSVATMLLAATSFMACSSDDDDDSGARSVSARTSGSIVGVVLDNKGEPVEGATVTLGGKSTKTNYGGEFEITGVNPNDSKLIKLAKSVTTTTTVSTVTDNTDANKPKTDTSISTSSKAETATGNDITEVKKTGYTLTVKKDGYLSGKVTGIYVTYQDTEDPEVTRANALLHGLEYDYQDILDRYATALTNVTANNGTTATTTTTATEDTTATTTTQTGSNADRVFKDISEAISALKSLYKTGSYTEYFSTFGTTTSPLIPLDASLKGKIKLNLKTRTGTTYDEKTYTPKSNPTVHVSYNSGTFNVNNGTTDVAVNSADYTWEAKVDSDGYFVFDKCLPSGVPLSITVDSFEEKITKEGATEAEAYWFSSASQVIYAEGTDTTSTTVTDKTTTSGTTTTVTSTTTDAGLTAITLGSKDANEKSYLIMLFAQNDKVWVTKTNVEPTENGSLLTKNDVLTFTFNKALKKVGATSTGITNLAKDAYTATLSEDKKTVTFTPNIGYWILTGDSQAVKLTVEAEDGAVTLLKDTFVVYFDNKVWVSVKELSYKDYNDYLKLSEPITLVFSKPMNEKIAVTLTNNTTAYEEKWNEGFTELTLTPDAKVGYWDIGSNTSIDITIVKAYANSKDSYIDTFAFWKVGAATDNSKATVYFDNYNDVTLAKAESGAGFTVTFAKAIKAQTESELKANLKVYNVGDSYAKDFSYATTGGTTPSPLSDVVLALSEDGKTITVTPQNTEFASYGYYALSFADKKFVAKTGESIPRKPATVDTVEKDSKTPFVTTFTLGTEFKYTAVAVVDKLPETALASRAIYVDNDKYLKITFNKAVRKSELQLNKTVAPATTAAFADVTNYIDGKDVYIPLATAADDDDVKVKGTVTSTDGQTWTLGSAAAGFDTLYKVNKLSYKMVATSLYTVKKAIAEGAAASAGNDALVNKIAPAETTITFTFAEDVSTATWSAEFYDSDNVKYKNLDQTPYVAEAVAAGKVVTVTLSGKDRDFNKTYYLSLKATKGTGDDVVVLYDSSKATSVYGLLPGSSSSTLDSVIIKDVTISGTTGNEKKAKYIEVVTKTEEEVAGLDNLYVVEASNNKASETTSVKDFAKSNASPIKLEFSEDITGFTGILANDKFYNKNAAADATNWLTSDVVDTSKTFASTYKVEGKVLTITPTFTFKSGEKVYPIVFNKDGKRVDLKKVTDKSNAAGTFASPVTDNTTSPATIKYDEVYTARNWTSDKDINDVIETTAASTVKKLNFAVFNKLEIGNGTPLHFQFSPILTETGTTANYGTYTLYKKVTKAAASAIKWEKVATYGVKPTPVPATAPYSYLASVDGKAADTTKDDKRFTSIANEAPVEDFAIRGLLAAISTTTDDDAFNYAAKASYKLVCEIDNVLIFSDVVTIDDATVLLTLKAGSPSPAIATIAENSETEIASTPSTDVVYYITSPSYLLSVDPSATFNNAVTESANRVSKAGKVEAIIDTATDPSRKTIKVTIKAGTTAVKKDKITITAKDAQQKAGTFVIEF